MSERSDASVDLPIVAVVGRPNVGKSTLVNRVLGRREAVVADVPGVTRDRVAYDAEWTGVRFTLVDTGGWQPEARGLAQQIAEQARLAMAAADVVVVVADATVGVTDADAAVARVLQRAGKPVVLAANKVDSERVEADAAELWSLGLGTPHPVSALHGRGSGDLLDAIVGVLPARPCAPDDDAGPRRVALVGRPNVGKSSLLNRLTGTSRAVVDAAAGTTRDPVDSLVELGETTWRFIDTAGLRRRVREASGSEYYASLRTERVIEQAEVALVMLDAGELIADQDLRVLDLVVAAGRALVLVLNKWDIVDEERRDRLEREVERALGRVSWAPRVNISAVTGRAVGRLAPALHTALTSWETRISTAELNAFVAEIVAATPPPVRGGKQPKILFATQAGIRPPSFVLFTTGPLEAGYQRFLERRLRERYGFTGSPLALTIKVRSRRGGR